MPLGETTYPIEPYMPVGDRTSQIEPFMPIGEITNRIEPYISVGDTTTVHGAEGLPAFGKQRERVTAAEEKAALWSNFPPFSSLSGCDVL